MLRTEGEFQLEIWGKVQSESSRRRKSYWEGNSWAEISPVAKSRGPNSSALADANANAGRLLDRVYIL